MKKHEWVYFSAGWGTGNECSCGFIAKTQSQVESHNRSNKNFKKRAKRRSNAQRRKKYHSYD